jgi:hypothetical protein
MLFVFVIVIGFAFQTVPDFNQLVKEGNFKKQEYAVNQYMDDQLKSLGLIVGATVRFEDTREKKVIPPLKMDKLAFSNNSSCSAMNIQAIGEASQFPPDYASDKQVLTQFPPEHLGQAVTYCHRVLDVQPFRPFVVAYLCDGVKISFIHVDQSRSVQLTDPYRLSLEGRAGLASILLTDYAPLTLPTHLLPPGFEVCEYLGSGHYAHVYEVTNDKQSYAWKVLKSKNTDEAKAEAKNFQFQGDPSFVQLVAQEEYTLLLTPVASKPELILRDFAVDLVKV